MRPPAFPSAFSPVHLHAGLASHVSVLAGGQLRFRDHTTPRRTASDLAITEAEQGNRPSELRVHGVALFRIHDNEAWVNRMLCNPRIERMVAEDGPRFGELGRCSMVVRANRSKIAISRATPQVSGYQNVTKVVLASAAVTGCRWSVTSWPSRASAWSSHGPWP